MERRDEMPGRRVWDSLPLHPVPSPLVAATQSPASHTSKPQGRREEDEEQGTKMKFGKAAELCSCCGRSWIAPHSSSQDFDLLKLSLPHAQHPDIPKAVFHQGKQGGK